MRKKWKLLDLFCKAGGCSKGYADAGFEVIGVDKDPQPNYPYDFIDMDVFDLDKDFFDNFDVIAASPPCQKYSVTRFVHPDKEHPDLIPPTRELLIKTGKPYVIENVETAPLVDPITLCGSSFNLRVRRHRLFESNVPIKGKSCDHDWQNSSRIYKVRMAHGVVRSSGVVPVFGALQLMPGSLYGDTELNIASDAMGIDWMTKWELNQAIPPAYTKFIGEQLIEYLEQND